MFFERFAWQAVFSRPFFQKNYPHSLAKCLSCRCRQQREKYAVLRQEQSVSCQSKILPRCHNSPFAHSAPSESCWGVPSPNPAMRLVPLENPTKKYLKNRPQNGGKRKELIPIGKRYNTPHRSHVVKTRMTEEEYPCSHCYQFSAYRGSTLTALHGQTGRYPCRVQAPLYGRCYGILQSRGHGDVPPGKSLSD